MTDSVLGWQPALATVLDQVVEAMNTAHDALLLRAGRARASGISWEIYGPELAGVLARTRGGGSARGPNVSGTFEQGLATLATFDSMSTGGGRQLEDLAAQMNSDGLRAVVTDDTAAGYIRDAAEGFPMPTIVIAYCQVRIRAGSHR